MFVRLRIMAHDALKNYMHSDHAPLLDETTHMMYDIIKTAETNEAFANEFDFECANAFHDETADDYDDLVYMLAEDMTEDLRDLLTRYNIINKED